MISLIADTSTLTGTILNLQRLSTEDGPGLRTTVFFKGCPLSCAWCHNPESISPALEMQWLENRCIGCNTCLQVCREQALQKTADGLVIDRSACTLCGCCSEACPSNALEMLGRAIGVDELIRELEKDSSYYERSGGGITLSGGEPTLQPGFAADTARALHQHGYHVALDTCGLAARTTFERILPYVDLVLFDLKLMDSQQHIRWTGQDNCIILKNLQWLVSWIDEHGGSPDLWIRTPLIPGATDTAENLCAIAEFLQQGLLHSIRRWELCAFNNLCRDKYRRLDKTWAFENTGIYARQALEDVERIIQRSGFPKEKFQITGLTRAEG